MNQDKTNNLSFQVDYIENIEINHEIASNCKLRSNFVHLKISQSRTKEAAYSVILLICEKGVRIMRPSDQIVLSSHSIKRISYSACDRINRLFALVVRSAEVDSRHMCFLFRMHTSEQAESVNRYFGIIFKQLNNRRKEKKLRSAHTNADDILPGLVSSLEINSNSEMSVDGNGIDLRFKQISTSNIDEKLKVRRLSLSMPMTECDEDDDRLEPLHSSLEKQYSAVTNNGARPFVRRKKPEYKGNRISAVIERLSFRGSRELPSEFLKSGSPVVALKEQLEYEELLSADSSLGSEPRHESSPNSAYLPHSQSKKQLLPSNSNLCITLDSKAAVKSTPSNLARMNSGPISDQLGDEQPPVPPVRIHSLRNTAFPTSLNIAEPTALLGSGEGASHSMREYDDDDDDFSSITTPSSCGKDNNEPVRFGIYKEPYAPPLPSSMRTGREMIAPSHSYVPNDLFPRSHSPISANRQSYPSNVPSQYFRDLNKEEAMDSLLDREIGAFLIRYSGSHRGSMALSVKVADNVVSHYIIQPQTSAGYRMKGLDKTWPDLESLITHLSVIPEMLPCPIRIAATSVPPQSQSATDQYEQRMKHFLDDISSEDVLGHDQYQQLSEFSSLVAGLDQ